MPNEISFLEQPLPFIGYSPLSIIYAVLTLVIGYFVLKMILGLIDRSLTKIKVPEIVKATILNLLKMIGIIAVLLAAAGVLGMEIGSLVLAMSAIIGLIFGFGMQDTIANLAAGIWLAVYRPFDIGDVVDIGGKVGKVRNISIMAVELVTADNVFIFVPSKNVWGSTITNYSRFDTRRVDVVIGVAYGTDLDTAIKVALETAKKHPDVLPEPEPSVMITELGDSSINLAVKVWTKRETYWKVKNDLTKMLYDSFNAAGIEIPYPQLDIHIRDMPRQA